MNIKNVFLWIVVLLAIYYGGRLMLGTGGGLDTANLAQGLSIATEARMLTNEYWAITGELPCEAGELDIRITSDYGPSVLAAVDVAGCEQIALVYNEKSGMPGQRMVLEAREVNGDQGLELASQDSQAP